MTRCTPIAIPEGLCSPAARFAGRCGESLKNWFRVENAIPNTADTVDIVIDGPIVDQFMADFLGIGVSSADVVAAIMAFRGQPLNVWINSDGGLVQDGLAIYNQLLMHDAPVTTIVYGGAMSIASVIAMAGETVIMAPTAMLFIHEASNDLDGTAADHQQVAVILDQLSEQIAGVYARRGDSRVNWRGLMQAGSGPMQGTLITAEEAVKRKLADRIDTSIARQPSNVVDFGAYAMVSPTQVAETAPVAATADTKMFTKRQLERLIHKAGVSNEHARLFLAENWADADGDDPLSGTDEPEITLADIATDPSSGMDEPEQEPEVETVVEPSPAALALIQAREREAYLASMWATPMMKG